MAEKAKETAKEVFAPLSELPKLKAKKESHVITVFFTDGTRESQAFDGKADDAARLAKSIGAEGYTKEVEAGVNYYPATQIKRVTVRAVIE